ncbi:hypothetical protein DOFOFD_10900 [Acetobacteraceae bacterium EV16P]|uniref:Uncharacterized protein n=1 Tax=Sorlinia euscelidii TaxID=3081148 RepID=A0ABU7U3T4_9PROT
MSTPYKPEDAIEHPLRLIFPGGNITYDIFIEALRGHFHIDIRLEPPLISRLGEGFDGVASLGRRAHEDAP